MSDWVNWADFADLQRPEMQRQADEREQQNLMQSKDIEKALAGLSDNAFGAAQRGTFGGLDQTAGYSALMAQRDAALQQGPAQQQASPWESELKGPQKAASPWAQLGSRLAGLNQRASERNTRQLNEERRQAQIREQQEFQRAQAAKMYEAMNGKRNRDAEAYAAWSDAVQNRGSDTRGSGASVYYDAARGTGPQPVTNGRGQRVANMQRRLGGIQRNQLMPPTTNSNFGQDTSGF